ncbi:ribosome-associated translation inhibitor RaiA [Kribbella voronezhensis]|uniref:Ribosome-associated translation inhibitor RaiA n=1 Tax=Kribbella voronezhensis TaxID=2512212 RepID=A0A4R7SX11_9ACTN|nr:HPF/RaiA family ribosome-associated protein [Kribbella voronezhensis]TDU83771.1 ribosome-associated translation inhibitor RaiA [Kribbella voronezhensis]
MTDQLTDVPLQLTLRGVTPRGPVSDALRKIERVLRRSPMTVLQARVVISTENNPAQRHPARIEVSALADGKPIRAHAVAGDITTAADQVIDRLDQRLDQVRSRNRTTHRRPRTATPRVWRHGGLPPKLVAARSEDHSRVIKRKTYLLTPMTAEQAADEMELLDHDFYLFIDAETGADAVVHRRHDGGYGVLGPTADAAGPQGSCSRPPVLTAAQARERLALTADRFLFYRDPDDDRARVLYRRYDGSYGLLVAS